MQDIIFSPISRDELRLEISETIRKELQPFLTALQETKPTTAPRFLTRKQAASKLSISLPTLNEWTKTGKVIGYRVSSRIRYKEDELESSLSKIKTRRN